MNKVVYTLPVIAFSAFSGGCTSMQAPKGAAPPDLIMPSRDSALVKADGVFVARTFECKLSHGKIETYLGVGEFAPKLFKAPSMLLKPVFRFQRPPK